MTLQTYTIEVKADLTDEQHDAMVNAMKHVAREFFTVATLLSGGRMPIIACRTTDAFYDSTEIETFEADA